MKKPIIILAIILGLIVAGLYFYFSGEDFKLYDEAKELEAKGDIYGAHDKIAEALKINPTNRKVISYKAQLYFLVKNNKLIKDALKYKEDAEKYLIKNDFSAAAQSLDNALGALDNVSSLSKEYDKAVELQKEIITLVDRIVKDAPYQYYKKALDLYYRGELERAYNSLEYIIKPDAKAIKLMDEIAYKIGSEKYDDVLSGKNTDSFFIQEGINWFNKVSKESPYEVDAKVRINRLKKYLKDK